MFSEAIKSARSRVMSAVSRVEVSFVIEGRKGPRGREVVDAIFVQSRIAIASVTPEQAHAAIQAFRRFGKGQHPASLNLGDCFSYALAKTLNAPLLFKGTDFAKTDIPAAIIPDR